ncbi:hypothetical protein ACNOYE_27285 [Nannocystaceae bacterium ST9]
MLELITRSKVRVRQGRASVWVETPFDFSNFSSEYIGILYEGLLDYELRRDRREATGSRHARGQPSTRPGRLRRFPRLNEGESRMPRDLRLAGYGLTTTTT